MADDIIHVSEDDPNRCQGIGKHGQCYVKAEPNSKFCRFHTGYAVAAKEKRNYRLKKWQHRVGEFADNSQIKSLREEIGILRMLLEEVLGKCNSSTELLLHSQKITTLVGQIEKLVVSCHKLEHATGFLMDLDQIMRFADNFLELLGRFEKDPLVLDQMADQVPLIIQQLGTSDESIGQTVSGQNS